jgi:hypothetical protein
LSSQGRQAKRACSQRKQESSLDTEKRLADQTSRTHVSREIERSEQRDLRLADKRSRTHASRANETAQDRSARQTHDRQQHRDAYQPAPAKAKAPTKNRKVLAPTHSALNYDSTAFISKSDIGCMDQICVCGALKFADEVPSMCCSNHNVLLDPFPSPPRYLQLLFDEETQNSKHFLENIRNYNCAFQMTSFGCNETRLPGWNPSFSVQGQVCHRIGSLHPLPNEPHQFLQIYFIDNRYEEAFCPPPPRI